MKNFIKKTINIFPVILFAGYLIFSNSCANTTTPPNGGPKDTIPPLILNIDPYPGSTNVKLNTQIVITFNEYVKVKDPKSIYLSPPLSKPPKYKMRGKKLIIYFEEKLHKNTTYSLDLTNAIVDNNEGNLFPGYTLVFSTGPKIDSMVVTGTVLDCNTLKPVKGATVMLYKNQSDSAIFKSKPDAAIKTDAWGYFALRNIPDTTYRLYAILDANNNNVYDPQNDKIAFCDSVIRPTMVANDTLKELLKYNMKDTLRCLARKSEHELDLFKERSSKQMIVKQVRVGARTAYLTFMAANPKIDSIWLAGYPKNSLITEFNKKKDSLEIWVNNRKIQMDTLHLFVDYLKTDSTGKLRPKIEHLRLVEEHKSAFSKSSRRNLRRADTTCSVEIIAKPENVEQKGFQINFKYPIINERFSAIKLTSINPRQQEKLMKFNVVRDSSDLKKYSLMPSEKLLKGYEYKLKVPARIFRDVNGFYNDSSEVKVSLPNDDKLSSLTIKLINVHHRYIVDLLNSTRTTVLRSYQIDKDTDLSFPYLKADKYSIRLTEDINSNGIVDTGNLMEHKQPEKVRFYRLRNNSYIISIRESMDLVQVINVGELFKD